MFFCLILNMHTLQDIKNNGTKQKTHYRILLRLWCQRNAPPLVFSCRRWCKQNGDWHGATTSFSHILQNKKQKDNWVWMKTWLGKHRGHVLSALQGAMDVWFSWVWWENIFWLNFFYCVQVMQQSKLNHCIMHSDQRHRLMHEKYVTADERVLILLIQLYFRIKITQISLSYYFYQP